MKPPKGTMDSYVAEGKPLSPIKVEIGETLQIGRFKMKIVEGNTLDVVSHEKLPVLKVVG